MTETTAQAELRTTLTHIVAGELAVYEQIADHDRAKVDALMEVVRGACENAVRDFAEERTRQQATRDGVGIIELGEAHGDD